MKQWQNAPMAGLFRHTALIFLAMRTVWLQKFALSGEKDSLPLDMPLLIKQGLVG